MPDPAGSRRTNLRPTKVPQYCDRPPKQEATAERTVKRGRDKEILPRAATHGANRDLAAAATVSILDAATSEDLPLPQQLAAGPPQSLGERTEVPEHGKAHLELLDPEEQRRQKGGECDWRSKQN